MKQAIRIKFELIGEMVLFYHIFIWCTSSVINQSVGNTAVCFMDH
jgi:hypothetical protein